MREGLARKYAPWGEFYADLTPMEQFDVCEELLREEYERKGDADPIKIAGLTNDQAVARRLATLASPMWDITHNMCVRNEKGEVGIFSPRYAQELAILEYERCVREQLPMRVLAPKPRRAGWSEAGSKIGGNLVFRNEGFRGLFIGQNAEDSESIFAKYKVQVSNDPLIKPSMITHMSRTNIELANGSGMSVRTAGASVGKKSGIGRGNIFHFFHGCLGAGSWVVDADTDELRRIEDFDIGDLVRTHTQAIAPISFISTKMADCVELSIQSMPTLPIVASMGHKFLTKDGWKTVSDLKEGDLLAYPAPKFGPWINGAERPFRIKKAVRKQGGGAETTVPGKIGLDYRLGLVSGLYLAEGCPKRQHSNGNLSSIIFAVDEDEVDRTVEWTRWLVDEGYASSVSVRDRKQSRTNTVEVYGKAFATFIVGMFGEKDGKRFGDWRFMPQDFVRGLVHGYLEGDGSFSKDKHNRKVSVTSTRSALAVSCRDALYALGYGWSGLKYREAGIWYGRNCQASWTLTLCGSGVDLLAEELPKGFVIERKRKAKQKVEADDDYIWLAIKSMDEVGEQRVYDFEVDHDDHSYCLPQVVSSNSEVAYWPDAAIKMMTGILSTMPRWPVWQTAAILESTGNGRDGYFFFKVREALDNPNGVWKVMFLPWTDLHDCFKPFAGPNAERDRKRMEEEILGPNGDPEEKELIKVHGATLEMVNWRRWAISGGLVDGVDEKERKRNFYQEYPLTVHDCFQAFGADTFSQDQINRQMRKVGPPLRQGDLTSPTALWTRSAKGTVSVTPTPNFKRKADGKVKLWADPVPGRQYVMGVDPSHGLLLGDPSCAVVIDRHEERIVAEWREHCDQEDCLTPVRLLSKLFNDATICVEINLGRLLIKWLKGTDRRKFLFRRKGESGIDQFEQVQDQFGFDINSKTKRQLVGLLREQLQHNPMFFSYEDILGEMLDFRQELNARKDDVIFPGVKEGAGRHDDRVIAASLALVAHVNLPSVVPSFFGGKRPEKLKVSDRWDLNSLGRKGLEQSRELEHPVLGTTKPGKGRGSGKKFINPTLGDSW